MGALKYYNESTEEWEYVDQPGGANSFVNLESPTSYDGITFTTSRPYVPGTIEPFINGLRQSSIHFTETNPSAGEFAFAEAVAVGSIVDVNYQQSVPPSGNASAIDGNSLSNILEALYPVGAIFVSGSDTMPSLVANIGTWARIEGRFIVGASDSDGDFDNGDTGGEKEHTLTTGEMPSHVHGGDGGSIILTQGGGGSITIGSGTNPRRYGSTSSSGGDDPHNNLPPYKAKYMWERTA